MLWHLEVQEGRLLGPVPPGTCPLPAVHHNGGFGQSRGARRIDVEELIWRKETRVAVRGGSTGLGTDRKTDVCMCASVSAYSDRTSSSKPALMTTLL